MNLILQEQLQIDDKGRFSGKWDLFYERAYGGAKEWSRSTLVMDGQLSLNKTTGFYEVAGTCHEAFESHFRQGDASSGEKSYEVKGLVQGRIVTLRFIDPYKSTVYLEKVVD